MSVMHVTSKNFESEVLKSEVPVLLDFWAPWCGPCKMIGPIVEELSAELSGQARIGKINVDEEMELASMFKVSSIPTIVTMVNGKITGTLVGLRPKEELKKLLSL